MENSCSRARSSDARPRWWRRPDADTVHITTPNRFHCEMSLAALRAGKHVVCEKLLAMNTTETAQLVKAARAAKRVFAVNYNIRFYPAVLQLRQLVERGDWGISSTSTVPICRTGT